MSEVNGAFAASLRELREATGMTQTDLARYMKEHGFPFHQPTVQRIESGDRPVRLDEAVAIADMFGINALEMCDADLSVPLGKVALQKARMILAGAEVDIRAARDELRAVAS